MGALKYLALLAILATTLVYALPEDVQRRTKAIGIFNLVQFPNNECEATATQRGTCYTAEECSDRNGVASGSCAEGYGVCCVITVACDATTAENSTYLTQTAATESCAYTICPRDATINRIKLDLTMFQIASPASPADVSGDADATSTAANRAAVGHCNVDSFSVTGAPTICGTNSGQHMIVDTDGTACVKASFSFGGDAGQTRSYNILVTQYARSDLNGGGLPGCLQWFTENTGTVSTFNWQGVAAASTHLANQNYNVCVRQNVGHCFICWSPRTTGSATTHGSFGLSNGKSDGANAKSGFGEDCAQTQSDANIAASNPEDSTDFVFIRGGNTASANGANAATQTANQAGGRFCGRFLRTDTDGGTGDTTICSRAAPFQITVHTDGIEAANAGADQAGKNEVADGSTDGTLQGPLGTIGFQLVFEQKACS